MGGFGNHGKTGGAGWRPTGMTPAPLRVALGLLALLLLLAQTGCLSFCHPVEPPAPEEFIPCKEIPQPCRNHVYVFFIHGMDPLDFADLSGVREYVHSLGFIKTYYGQLYHTWYFTDEIRQIHQRDPEARFVLVGFSFGANMVRNVANKVRGDGVAIDVIVYLGGNTLTNSEEDRPPNVGRIVNILATGWIWNGTTLDNAQNINYDNVWHFGSPTHPETLDVLAHELAEVASHVPFVEQTYPQLETAPTPRPVIQQISKKRDAWDFLESGGEIPMLPPKPAPVKSPSRDQLRSAKAID
jgi:hypothetical protein